MLNYYSFDNRFSYHAIKFVFLTLLFINILFYGCATTQEMILTNEKILNQTEQLEHLDKTVSVLKKKDSSFELELQDLLTHIADLETQIKHDHEQLLTFEARIEDYRQLLDRSISDAVSENEKTLMKLERAEVKIDKLSKELKAIQNAQINQFSQTTYNTEDLNEESFYDLAYDSFKKGEFDKAREQFNAFIERFPTGKFSDNARFWIGECYYRKNQYEEAILEYEKVKNDYPSGDKVPSALFKQALSFLKLNKQDEAKIILKNLIQHYPQSEQAEMAKDQLGKL